MSFDALADVNQDFRESQRMVSPGKKPALELFGVGSSPFAGVHSRLTRNYVRRDDIGD